MASATTTFESEFQTQRRRHRAFLAGATLVLLGPWLLSTMVDYIRSLLDSIPGLAS